MWIDPCLEGKAPMRWSGSSIYPAVQNMLLAARALGLGATLTTLHLQFEKEAEGSRREQHVLDRRVDRGAGLARR